MIGRFEGLIGLNGFGRLTWFLRIGLHCFGHFNEKGYWLRLPSLFWSLCGW
ncbi:MAG: hypothetical protein ACTS6H_02000 [Candidatus Hodgkinia cicadicola]